MPEWGLIAGQAASGGVALWLMARFVWPAAQRDEAHGLRHVWAPFVILAPLLFFARAPQWSVAGEAWLGLGVPIIAAAVALGGLLLITPGPAKLISDRMSVIAGGVGLLFLLLGWAHELHMLIGQAAFAIAALLLWINSPPHKPADQIQPNPGGIFVIPALLLAIVQGLLAARVSEDAAVRVSHALIVLWVIAILISQIQPDHPERTFPTLLWTASLGVLLAIGTLSLRRLVPELLKRASAAGDEPVTVYAAYGFGLYAAEALLLLILPAIGAYALRQPRLLQRAIGAGLVLAGLGLALWRIASL